MNQESDKFVESLERRWFAALNACNAQRHDCEHIRQSLQLADRAWRHANLRLRELEEMRDSLGTMLAEIDASRERSAA